MTASVIIVSLRPVRLMRLYAQDGKCIFRDDRTPGRIKSDALMQVSDPTSLSVLYPTNQITLPSYITQLVLKNT